MPVEEKPVPADPAGRPRRDPFTLFLVVACIALAVLVIVLARQNRQLKSGLAALLAPELPADALKTGDRVEPIALLGEGSRKELVEFSPDGPKTLLLVFSAHCPACEKTLPIWNDFLASAPAGLRTIGIQTDRPGAAPDVSGIVPASLRFPVFSVATPKPSALDKMPYVPVTVLLDGHGRVVRVWFGIPTKKQLDELRELASG
jgi:hypothetical protein